MDIYTSLEAVSALLLAGTLVGGGGFVLYKAIQFFIDYFFRGQ